MGKNKDRLNQKSIPWADSILDQVMNLPPAGGEDLQSTTEAQTTAVEELMKMVSRKIAMNNGEGQYVWKKLTAEGGDFIDFVVSNGESDYPNGAVHTDGYWYELVKEGYTPTTFSLSKLAIDSFTPASSTVANKMTIQHSLGQTPDVIIIFANNYAKPTNKSYTKITALFGRNNAGTKLADYGDPSNTTFHFYKQHFYWYSSSTVMPENTTISSNAVNTTTIKVNDSTYHFYGGETYTVITGAFI